MELDLLIRDGRICREDTPPSRGSIGVRDGRIVIVAASAAGLDAKEIIDADDRFVTPGMIDPHVHIGHGGPPRERVLDGGKLGRRRRRDDDADLSPPPPVQR